MKTCYGRPPGKGLARISYVRPPRVLLPEETGFKFVVARHADLHRTIATFVGFLGVLNPGEPRTGS